METEATCSATEGGQACELAAGHEDPAHPAHVKHRGNGEPLHRNKLASWPVDIEGAKMRAAAARAARLEQIRKPVEE